MVNIMLGQEKRGGEKKRPGGAGKEEEEGEEERGEEEERKWEGRGRDWRHQKNPNCPGSKSLQTIYGKWVR